MEEGKRHAEDLRRSAPEPGTDRHTGGWIGLSPGVPTNR
jgi:hypothetical protein